MSGEIIIFQSNIFVLYLEPQIQERAIYSPDKNLLFLYLLLGILGYIKSALTSARLDHDGVSMGV